MAENQVAKIFKRRVKVVLEELDESGNVLKEFTHTTQMSEARSDEWVARRMMDVHMGNVLKGALEGIYHQMSDDQKESSKAS